ncbi:major facilitator superfamily domain-containing protein [Trichoderma ceciliae]
MALLRSPENRNARPSVDLGNSSTVGAEFVEPKAFHDETGTTEQSTPVQSDNEEAQNDNSQSRDIRGFRWIVVCVSLYIGTFLYGLDTTIAADVQGAVVEDFGHVDQLAWVGAGFPLGSVAIILLVGTLYTTFNMKWLYMTSVLLFEIGSVICGAAPNMNAMIVGRVIAGGGGSGIYLGCLNYFSTLTSRKERGTYISLIAFCWGLGAVLGPVVGGSFSVSSATWRWAFYINLVIGAVTAPIYIFFLPTIHPIKGVSVRDRVMKLDFIGIVLGAGVWVAFTLATTMAGGQWPWKDSRTVATWVVFGVVLIAYALQQYFKILTTDQTRSFPGHLLKSRTQVLLFVVTAAAITSLFVVVYYIPIYFQFVHNDTALLAAVRLLPFVIITVTFNLLSGHLLSRIQYYMPVYLISGVLITLGGSLLMVYLQPTTPEAYIYGFSVIIAVGTGLSLQIGYAVATLKVPSEQMGDAIKMQNVSQIGGTVLALVIAGQVFQSSAVNNLGAVLKGHGFTESDIHDIVAGTQSELFAELNGDLKQAAIAAITSATQNSFILVVVAGATILVSSLAMRFERLFGEIIIA